MRESSIAAVIERKRKSGLNPPCGSAKISAQGNQRGCRYFARHDRTQEPRTETGGACAPSTGLTGIVNRRDLDERLENEWARAGREGTTLSLLLVDVDHFKKFNDEYGHLAGDACLQAVAKILAEQARRAVDVPLNLSERCFRKKFLCTIAADTHQNVARTNLIRRTATRLLASCRSCTGSILHRRLNR